VTDSALSMHRLIAFHAFFAAVMDACSSQKRGLLTSNLMRKPSVCSEESIGFYGGKQWFPREKPMVSDVETDGLQRRKTMVSHEEHKGLPWGHWQQNGWVWMQKRPKKLHFWLILPRICHSATISVTSQPIVFQPFKSQVTDLQIFDENF